MGKTQVTPKLRNFRQEALPIYRKWPFSLKLSTLTLTALI